MAYKKRNKIEKELKIQRLIVATKKHGKLPVILDPRRNNT
jgi:hypothetical protein